jgi:DNA-binding CsgD family transcriptional regulator
VRPTAVEATTGSGAGRTVAREIAALAHAARSMAVPSPPAELGARILETVADLVPYAAAAFSIWDPIGRTHRTLANEGYADSTLAYLNAADDIGIRRAYEVRRALRWGSAPFDYRPTYGPRYVFGPAGYDEGMTACLFTEDGRYTGMLNVSTATSTTPTDETLTLFDELGSLLALVTDATRSAGWLALLAEVGASAAAVTPSGELVELPGRSLGPVLGTTPALVDLAREVLALKRARRSFLWLDPAHGWQRVEIVRVGADPSSLEDVALLTAAATVLPYALTARELDVLTLVACGNSNGEIALHFGLSPRTVATHLERVLQKLGVPSRAGAAALAVEQGLLRVRSHDTELRREAGL